MSTIPAHRTAEAAVDRAPELRLVHGGADVDLAASERAVADLPAALGQDLDDEHLGMALRGVRAAGSRATITSALHGLLRDDPASRADFLAPAGVRP